MKLNVDILSEGLSDIMPLKQHGHSDGQLRLSRPLLYDGKSTFEADHVYITSIDYLPKTPDIENGTVIICAGKELPEYYYSEQCVLLLLNTTKNIYSVFNAVQKIFDKYDEWDAKLKRVIMERGKINTLLEVSKSIFENPMFILDNDLEIIANSIIYEENIELGKELHYRKESPFRKFLLTKDTQKKKNIYTYNKFTYNKMCINLFKEREFIGGIYIKGDFIRSLRAGDKGLLLHLKTYVDFLLNQYHEILSVDNNMMKDIFIKILDGDILKDNKLLKEVKLNQDRNDKYVCIKFKLEASSKVIQAKSVCEQIEDILPGTIAMVYQNTIVAFMNYRLSTSNPINKSSILINFLQAMGYKAGLSEEFSDVLKARYYFREACAAIDIGYPLNPELEVYYFKDYIKEYIYSIITSKIPVEMICAKGLLRLLDYDKLHNTIYFNELRTYLNCNMNAVQAAKKLYMHRNTLLTHLDHINKLIGIDLEDPDERMYLQLSYKLLESEGVSEVF